MPTKKRQYSDEDKSKARKRLSTKKGAQEVFNSLISGEKQLVDYPMHSSTVKRKLADFGLYLPNLTNLAVERAQTKKAAVPARKRGRKSTPQEPEEDLLYTVRIDPAIVGETRCLCGHKHQLVEAYVEFVPTYTIKVWCTKCKREEYLPLTLKKGE